MRLARCDLTTPLFKELYRTLTQNCSNLFEPNV